MFGRGIVIVSIALLGFGCKTLKKSPSDLDSADKASLFNCLENIRPYTAGHAHVFSWPEALEPTPAKAGLFHYALIAPNDDEVYLEDEAGATYRLQPKNKTADFSCKDNGDESCLVFALPLKDNPLVALRLRLLDNEAVINLYDVTDKKEFASFTPVDVEPFTTPTRFAVTDARQRLQKIWGNYPVLIMNQSKEFAALIKHNIENAERTCHQALKEFGQVPQ